MTDRNLLRAQLLIEAADILNEKVYVSDSDLANFSDSDKVNAQCDRIMDKVADIQEEYKKTKSLSNPTAIVTLVTWCVGVLSLSIFTVPTIVIGTISAVIALIASLVWAIDVSNSSKTVSVAMTKLENSLEKAIIKTNDAKQKEKLKLLLDRVRNVLNRLDQDVNM